MKKLLLILLGGLLVLSFAGCEGNETETPKQTTSVSQNNNADEPAEIKEKLSWEKINAFPIKRSDMTEEEMRQLVVDFYIFSKTFVWVADNDYTYQVADGAGRESLETGGVYAGFPYISKGTSNVYRLMDFMDPQTGVLHVADAGANSRMLGNQCSMSCQWAWARVVNSVKGGWTDQITQANGYIPVGPYTYSADLEEFNKRNSIESIVAENGQDIMNQSYAQLKAGDGLVKSGHVILCTGAPYVVYDENGAIDPAESYILMSEQTRNTGWKGYTNDSGDQYLMCGNINKKYSFKKLYEQEYLPFTFKEYTGADPIEKTEVSFSHTGQTISKEQLMGAKVTSNYYISDIYAAVTDSKGNEVYRFAVRNTAPASLELVFTEDNKTSDGNPAYTIWGSWEALSSDEEYTVQIIAQLGTGERPTLWEGKLER